MVSCSVVFVLVGFGVVRHGMVCRDVAWHGMHELRDETEVASDEGDAHSGHEHAHDDKRARGERTTRSAAKRPRTSSHSHAHDDADGHEHGHVHDGNCQHSDDEGDVGHSHDH